MCLFEDYEQDCSGEVSDKKTGQKVVCFSSLRSTDIDRGALLNFEKAYIINGFVNLFIFTPNTGFIFTPT